METHRVRRGQKDTGTMNQTVFDDAVQTAISLSGPDPYDGMASVTLRWNPYEVHWEAFADWSSGIKLHGEPSESVDDAILSLIDQIKETRKELKGF